MDGTGIRETLKIHRLSQEWLIARLAERGIVTNRHELSNVLSVRRKGPKADAILAQSAEIVDEYTTLLERVIQD